MTDPDPQPERSVEDHRTPPNMPRWVKVSAIVVVVVVLVLVLIMALAGGEHGPGLHSDSSASSGVAAPMGQLEAGKA